MPTSYIEIDEKAIQSNIHFIKSLLPKHTILSSVVKGNAYGHEIETYVPLAEKSGVSHFSVYSSSEAKRVNKVANNATILIMGYIDEEDLNWVISNAIEFFIFDESRLLESIRIAKELSKKAIIHLEIETGLNRTGFLPENLLQILKIIKENIDFIDTKGICSHLAGAESISNYFRIKQQISIFSKTVKKIEKEGISIRQKHLACSAAIINHPSTCMDLVRVGIMQYGLWSSKETQMNYLTKQMDKTDPLKRVIAWKSKVCNVKEVNAGEFIGYGTSFLAEQKMKIAQVPVGYSDGYSRSLSNHGKAILNNQKVDVIGIINMNSLLLDVSNINHVELEDEVILIGNSDNQSVSIASFSELSNLLNYELLTRIPSTIPRIVKS